MRLQDKVIIVTGSTTGIGRAIALKCVAEGARVVVHGLEDEWGQETMQSLETGKAVLHIRDLTEPGAAQALVDTAIQHFGRLDAIVNNAAWVVSSNISTTDRSFLEKVFLVNTIAPLELVKAALPYLALQHGSVLNIGSVNAWSGEPNLLAYSMSKGALMTMTRNLGDSLHREYAVRVNQINPGWVLTETEIKRKRDHGLADDWYKEIPAVFAPAGRIYMPAEIAAAAIYWISDEAGPVSGQVIDLEQHPMIGRNMAKDSSTLNIFK